MVLIMLQFNNPDYMEINKHYFKKCITFKLQSHLKMNHLTNSLMNSPCKTDQINSTEWLNNKLNTIILGKLNLLFYHTLKETMLITLMSMTILTGKNIKKILQRDMRRTWNIKVLIQLLKINLHLEIQRMNSLSANLTLLDISNMLTHQMRRDFT